MRSSLALACGLASLVLAQPRPHGHHNAQPAQQPDAQPDQQPAQQPQQQWQPQPQAQQQQGQQQQQAAAPANAAAQAVASSEYWHDKYHGILAMSAFGAYDQLCPQFFTQAAMLKNFPNSQAQPWTVISRWGPTPKWGMHGYSVIVPEMNKVVVVIGGPALASQWLTKSDNSFVPLNLNGCNGCMVHGGALEAFNEAAAAAGNWDDVAQNRGPYLWSSAGYGFGGMVVQIAALMQGAMGRTQFVHSFGSPAVMNNAAAQRYAQQFPGTNSFRTVANQDRGPTLIPINGDITMTNTGFAVWGQNATYGQNYEYCYGPQDPRCLGGQNEADGMFYYSLFGHCGENYQLQTYNPGANQAVYASLVAAAPATATSSSAAPSSSSSVVIPATSVAPTPIPTPVVNVVKPSSSSLPASMRGAATANVVPALGLLAVAGALALL